MPVSHSGWTLYTDGACSGNPGPGGYAAILVAPLTIFTADEIIVTGAEPHTTNNRMELMAIIAGLQAAPESVPVTVVTDSEYVVNTMTRNWKRKANQDLWAQLDALAAARKLKWQHVRGHAGHSYNERCDQLAVAEISKLRQRSRTSE